jgi:hypothetical protein
MRPLSGYDLVLRSASPKEPTMRTALVLACLFVSSTLACAVDSSSTEGGIDASEDALSTYRIEASVTPSPVVVGSTPELAIRVVGSEDGPVTKFDDLHTQPMHVVAVSSDLKDFLHVHPVLGDDGVLEVAVPITQAQPYRFFFEYDPLGPAGQQTNRATLRPQGGQPVAPALASAPAIFDGSAAKTTATDGTRVTLEPVAGHGMVMPNMATTLRVSITTAAGAPVTDLVDWLGMPGHAIVLSEDSETFIHAHGMRPGTGGHGGHGGHEGHGGTTPAAPPVGAANLLDVELTVPQAGLYKMFVQFKRGETVMTAPFVLRSMQH